MQVGNARYLTEADFPENLPIFPLAGALLLPAGHLPLNIFEPRYIAMFDAALASDRLIGMIQPAFNDTSGTSERPALCQVGCIGRITSLAESGDGRYIVSLAGVCRFRVIGENNTSKPYRSVKYAPFMSDLACHEEQSTVDREGLLASFRDYLMANKLEADWDSVGKASNLTLVNSLSMMAPFGPAEKQALLEAPDLKTRAETLVAITEIVLARDGDADTIIQ